MTPASDSKPAGVWVLLDLPGLARFSLAALAVTFVGNPSCLLTTAAEYPVPVPSPPFADTNTALATPQGGGAGVPITRLLRVDDDTQEVELSTDVRADDAGRQLRSRAFINYRVETDMSAPYLHVFKGQNLAPSTFDDVRKISASFTPGQLPDGCYQVALVITHKFDEFERIPVSQDDTAIVVWWMVKGDPSTVDFGQCPGVPPAPEHDAGADGGGS